MSYLFDSCENQFLFLPQPDTSNILLVLLKGCLLKTLFLKIRFIPGRVLLLTASLVSIRNIPLLLWEEVKLDSALAIS